MRYPTLRVPVLLLAALTINQSMNKSSTTCSPPSSSIPLLLFALIFLATGATAQTSMDASAAISAAASYWIPDTAADPHTKNFHIPVYIDLPSGIPACNPDAFTIEVAFNATRFFPKSVTRGTIVNNEVVGENRVVEISLAGTTPVTSGVLTALVGDVLLGNSETTPLQLRSVKCNGVQVADSVEHGFFRMIGEYCEEGSDRLLVYRSGFGISKIAPNPANGPVRIETLGVEFGETSLEVYSAYGERVFVESWNPSGESELRREVALPGSMPAGIYEVVFRSPGRHDVQSLVITR